MKNKQKTLDEILPEGLSESSVEEITNLMQDVINERVQDQVSVLEAKVASFVRANIDSLKEQAIKELELENDTYRNAQLFETVRSLMAVEMTEEDDANAIKVLTNESKQMEGELGILTKELDNVLKENNKLQTVVKVLSDKAETLEEERDSLEEAGSSLYEEMKLLKETTKKPFKSSEKAVVVSENNVKVERTRNNEFLTEDMMKFMP
jgi:superfamily I DNA and/or RNA helicase